MEIVCQCGLSQRGTPISNMEPPRCHRRGMPTKFMDAENATRDIRDTIALKVRINILCSHCCRTKFCTLSPFFPERCTTAENGMKYEIQKFHCHVRPGEDGHQPSFKLSFGPSHSQPIPANASLDELASSLRLLPTIHNVSISLSNTDASRICSTNDTRWEISVEFLDAVTHGHLLMPLGFDESKLHVSSAIRVQTLDAVVDECNGHGLCSPETGLCTCSEAWRGSYDCGKRSSTQT
eukprot:gb/GECG01003865.1/.p1 GENE.gb/GECG01003865.1/~~gb/GECG01003865.1/.p1  ORF type:complete len:237 (+),score=5.99 gb/GECG01003865.1/:1-711(+)